MADDLEKPIAPRGEEIHLPGGSLHPILLAFGLTFAIVGITTSLVVLLFGAVLSLGVIIAWIAGARREYAELPAEHKH